MSSRAATAAAESARHPKKPRIKRAGHAGWLFLLPLVALWVVPVAIFALLVPASHSAESAALAPGSVQTVAVGSRTDSAQQAVDAVVTAPPPTEIKSAASGIVTQLEVKTAATITNGEALLSLNGTPVLAYVASSPLYRDLAVGSQGVDVEALITYLVDLHLLPAGTSGQQFTSATAAGASALQEKIGITPDGAFHLSEVAWVDSNSATAGAVKVRVGDTVTTGDALVESASTPTAVTFSVSGESSTRPVLPKGPLRLTAGDLHVDLSSDSLSAADRALVGTFYAKAVAAGTVTATPATGTTTFTGATLSTKAAPKVGVVPSSAIYQADTGKACVFTSNDGNISRVALTSPKLLTGELGSVSVPASLSGQRVVTNPASLSDSLRALCK